jgi:alginate O-acetyltransferase complex protein AlgI
MDFLVARSIWESKTLRSRKTLLICSISGNLGVLGFFKYADFAVTQFNILGSTFDIGQQIPLLNIVLPIGISFYTFQSLSYTIDVYRREIEPSKSLSEFALFVAFFPQLVAGPIVRAKQFLPQLREIHSLGKTELRKIKIDHTNLKFGITLIAFGLFKKMFFADNIAPLVNAVFADPTGLGSVPIMLGALAFGIQIYADFSGYSDIAIGAALILGFNFPLNFNKPYFATSPSDFWRRWHISLSSWLRDYLYIPLGGNRKSSARTYLNLIIVMFLGGLWHGASWNFVIWGLLHGGYLAIHKAASAKFGGKLPKLLANSRIGWVISFVLTQYFVFLAWIPFRVQDIDNALYSMGKYLFFDFQTNGVLSFVSANRLEVMLIIFFIALHVISYKKPNLVQKISRLRIAKWIGVLVLIMIMILFLFNGNPEDFIYFQF